MYLLLVQKHAEDIGAAESLHLNSYNTLPMLLLCSFVSGELRSAVRDFALSDIGFVVTFTIVIVFGCLLNYLLFLCTTYNSALTTSITGTLKTIVQTVIGMFTFGGISINVFTILGMTFSVSAVFNSTCRYAVPTSTFSLWLTSLHFQRYSSWIFQKVS